MTNPKDFLLNTDYEMDKIILVKTGSFVDSKDIQHGLNLAPLPFGIWSTDQNFNIVNTIGVTDSSAEPGYSPELGVTCTSYNDKITIQASGDGSATTTIYYRLFAFESPNSTQDIAGTSDLATEFVLNTDYNYRKLKASGTFTQSGETFTHNLGYIPQIMAWADYSAALGTGVQPLMSASNSTNHKVVVTNTTIRVGTLISGEKIYWRVYYDEA